MEYSLILLHIYAYRENNQTKQSAHTKMKNTQQHTNPHCKQKRTNVHASGQDLVVLEIIHSRSVPKPEGKISGSLFWGLTSDCWVLPEVCSIAGYCSFPVCRLLASAFNHTAQKSIFLTFDRETKHFAHKMFT